MHVSGISWQMIIKDIRGNIQFYVLKLQKKNRDRARFQCKSDVNKMWQSRITERLS